MDEDHLIITTTIFVTTYCIFSLARFVIMECLAHECRFEVTVVYNISYLCVSPNDVYKRDFFVSLMINRTYKVVTYI